MEQRKNQYRVACLSPDKERKKGASFLVIVFFFLIRIIWTAMYYKISLNTFMSNYACCHFALLLRSVIDK